MDYATFTKLNGLFGHDHTLMLSDMVEDIRDAHTTLAVWIRDRGDPITGPSMVQQVARNAVSCVLDYLENSMTEDSLPLLPDVTKSRTEDFKRWYSEQPFGQIEAAIVAAYLFETRKVQARRHNSIDLYGGTAIVDAEFASYAAWTNISESGLRLNEKSDALFAEFKKNASAHIADAQEKLQAISDAVIATQRDHAEAALKLNHIDERSRTAETETAKIVDTAQTLFTSFETGVTASGARLDALREDIATLSVKKLWNQRAKSSAVAFGLSCGLLGLLLLGGPICVLVKLDWTLALLKHIGEATMQGLPDDPTPSQFAIAAVSKLVVITLPIVLYVWLIKLVVRFNLRSLMLMDDARQRHTMMDTYFHLIAEQVAVREDRALILAALFRPGPGQGGDTVEPPNFTELLDKAMPK